MKIEMTAKHRDLIRLTLRQVIRELTRYANNCDGHSPEWAKKHRDRIARLQEADAALAPKKAQVLP